MKLTLRFLLLLVTLLAAVGTSEYQGSLALNQLGAALERVVDSDMERVFAITHVRRLFRSMVVLEGDYLLSKSDVDRQAMDRKMSGLGKEQLEQIDKYARLMPAEDALAINDIRAVRDRWIARDTRVRVLASTDPEKALATAKLHAKDPVNWEKTIGSLVKTSETRLAKQVTETKVIHTRAKRNLALVALTAGVFALGFGLVIFLGIRRNIRDIVALNTRLERRVSERTRELAERERSLRLVLDSTGDAFIELDREGRLSGATSAATIRWFGEYAPNMFGSAYLFRDDPVQQTAFDMGFAQLIDDVLPWELSADQMPQRDTMGDTILELEYKQVLENDALSKVLVIARDVTARVHSEVAEKNAREQQAVLGKLLSDKAGFVQFVADCENLITSLSSDTNLPLTKRNLHTLKGNAAVYGMTSIAEYCHNLEDQLATTGESLPSSNVADLAALWRSRMQSIQTFISGIGNGVLEIDTEEHMKLIESLMGRRDYGEILAMVEMWSWCRASERLTRLRGQAEYIAKRTGKEILVVIEHNDIRIPNDYLSRFWPALIHVVRNAVGHGIEAPAERTAKGKPARGTLALAMFELSGQLVLEVRDDGSGVDVPRVLAVAKARGISLPANASLVDIITAEGVSTNEQTTDLSGRGIGLAAVRHACEIEGGNLSAVNDPGKGLALQFRFRMPIVKPGALAEKLEKRWSLMPLVRTTSAARSSETLCVDSLRKSS